jgi:hypothetical protein
MSIVAVLILAVSSVQLAIELGAARSAASATPGSIADHVAWVDRLDAVVMLLLAALIVAWILLAEQRRVSPTWQWLGAMCVLALVLGAIPLGFGLPELLFTAVAAIGLTLLWLPVAAAVSAGSDDALVA